ncbi:MAG: cation transporter [Candidatus Omnitrophica bacterium]|nr:cation transporter [Candidatus Omnitrophota bacterium]
MSEPIEVLPSQDVEAQRFAMWVSLLVGFSMLIIKVGAYVLTGSAAILSDAAESVVHVGAVGFATYSLWLSQTPPDEDHLYGHERISYFSAGVEGGLIIAAALFIMKESIPELWGKPEIESLDWGTGLVALAGGINAILGWYLVHLGKKQDSLILEANGRHVLTDTWTSVGVVVGLLLVLATGWTILDPIMAILVALNIVFSGYHLIQRATFGLMDRVNPKQDAVIREILEKAESEGVCRFHELRHRNTGRTAWVEVHLLFPEGSSLKNAHRGATEIEEKINAALPGQVIVTTHLEPLETHKAEHHGPENPSHLDPSR